MSRNAAFIMIDSYYVLFYSHQLNIKCANWRHMGVEVLKGITIHCTLLKRQIFSHVAQEQIKLLEKDVQ